MSTMQGRTGRNVALLGALLISGCIEARTYKPIIPPAPTVPQPRIPQNNAYTGSIHSPRPGALQPRFTWTASTTQEDDPLVYELQLSASRDFGADALTFQTRELEHQPPDALPVSTTPPVGRRYFWRVRACLPLICSEYSAIRWINLGRSDHDYNGDGYADVLVGAPYNDDNGMNAGKAYVYFGGAGATFDTAPDGVLAPGNMGNTVGEAVASAGDFDGDGYADIVVGAPLRFGQGVAFVFFGGFGPTFDPTPDVVLGDGGTYRTFGRALAGVGDVNGDGYDDILVGAPDELTNTSEGSAYLFLGNAEGKKPMGIPFSRPLFDRHFGDHVSGIGDLNGDGLADFAVSDATLFISSISDCHAYLYLGRTMWTNNPYPDDEATFRRVGCRLIMDAAGDLNQDGYSDVLQGGGDAISLEFISGEVTLLLGTDAPKWPTRSLFVTSNANSMAGIGDVNGDSFPDFAVSKGAGPTELNLFFGAERLSSPVPPSASATGQPAKFARSLAEVGDLNGDGLDDLLVGDPGFSSNRGAAYVYFGIADDALKFDFANDGALDAGAAEASFGYAVAALEPKLTACRARIRESGRLCRRRNGG
jgi:hypothetical protein